MNPSKIKRANFYELKKKYKLNKKQEMILQYFWMFPNKSFTVLDIVKAFREKYGEGITKDNIAPRISELLALDLLVCSGQEEYEYRDPMTGQTSHLSRGKYRLTDFNEQQSFMM